jgi:DNA-directed RNA polymerase specialized sigma24 family protein
MSGDPVSWRGLVPLTHWSEVGRAGQGDPAALDRLLGQYFMALKTYLVKSKRIPSDQAEDLLQSFVMEKIIQGGLLGQARQHKGRFRTFLLSALQNFVISEWRKRTAPKRAPRGAAEIPLDRLGDTPAAVRQPDRELEVIWAKQVLAETLQRMEAECRAKDRLDLWGVFECRDLAIVDGAPPLPYNELVARFGFRSPVEAANAVTTARRMCVRNLREVVAQYVQDESQVEKEIQALWEILSGDA